MYNWNCSKNKMDSDEERQNYLRVNILEKGYDAEDFVAFLTTKREKKG